ncbi:isomerase [Marinomonas ushuaiensis DSM 15871]|uniref:Isomerase n=1 Tax=Marinomonas ushuaiensis DSM 15871 TaxID=1122207 RepID=X7E3D4_9GAMM|nr:TIM barrel protein [Marinomonas ushuaiensis]ETX09686.1 isomerase [Marinomonas ushuaiensis DSM 15871]
MTKFSANLGFLWSELPLPSAIYAAKSAGFDAVECHWPYDYSPLEVKNALNATGLKMLGINTRRGVLQKGENGLSALPERETEARAAIDEAINYAREIGASSVHVMAGFAKGEKAHNIFISNLKYACKHAKKSNITILIEPLNEYDAPHYFLSSTDQARSIIEEVNSENLKLMFDCYHVQLLEGDLTNKLKELMPIIGHIQFASVPDRAEPFMGEINYRYIFSLISELGFSSPLGAEYKPSTEMEESLKWLRLHT